MNLRKSMMWSRERAVSLRCDKASAGRLQFTPGLDLSQRCGIHGFPFDWIRTTQLNSVGNPRRVLSHFCGLACRMFRLARTAGSRFGRKHRDCKICYGVGLEGYRFGVSWCGITNKVLDTHVVFQEPRLTAVFAEASERHIHDPPSAQKHSEYQIHEVGR